MSLVLLTVGFQTYSSDDRFSLDFQHPNNYRLRISRVKMSDRGYYHCQLATHPPQLVWTYLELVRPTFRILDGENSTLAELHYHAGTSVTLQCEVVRAPLGQSSVQWVVKGNSGLKVLNKDISRGGILINSYELDKDTLISNLTLHKAGPSDKGIYTCSLPNDLASLGNHSVTIHILSRAMTEPVHGRAIKPVIWRLAIFVLTLTSAML